VPAKYISYGTAGFRTHGDLLDRAFFRSGVLMAIRAKQTGLGGLMITASHNPK
jgi:phosphomannomutase